MFRFGRFNLVGLLGAALQLAVLQLLTRCLHLPVLVATPVAVEIAVLHNFVWHERFTWRERRVGSGGEQRRRFWRFHIANGLISVVGNTLLTYWLVRGLGAPVLLSAAAGIALCSVINFLVADKWVFERLS